MSGQTREEATPRVSMHKGRPPRLFRAGSAGQSLGVYLPATVVSRCLGLVRGVALAWLISEREFGLLQIALLTLNILVPLCSIGLNEAVTRYVPQYETRGALRPFLGRVVLMVLGVGGVLSAAVYFAADPVGRFLFATLQPGSDASLANDAGAALTQLAAGTTLALIAYLLLWSVLKGLRMFRAVSLMELVHSVAFTIFSVLAAWGGWKTVAAVLVCYSATLVGVVVLFLPPLTHVIKQAGHPDEGLDTPGIAPRGRPLVAQLLRFSLWAAAATVLWQTLLYYPMWYLHKTCGQQGELTAIFGAMRLLTQAVFIAAVAVVTVVQTSVTKTWESQGPATADRQLRFAFKAAALVLLLGCAVVAVSRRLLAHLFPAAYAGGVDIIPLLLLFFLVGAYLSFLGIHFILIEKTRYLFWPSLVGVACNVGFGRWLLQPGLEPAAALAATAWTGVLGITAALVTCLVLIRVARRSFDVGSAILLVAAYALALPAPLLMCVVVVAILLAVGTHLIFAPAERQRLRDHTFAAGRKVRQWASRLTSGF